MIEDFDAIILAGGRGRRLGGVRKPELTVSGRRLIDIALAAVASAAQVVVVGDIEVPESVLLTREDPPFGGPVAAVAAAMDVLATHAPWTVLLASDLPDAEAAVARLLSAQLRREDDGGCLVAPTPGPSGSRLQWLLGCYRTEALLARLADRGDPPVTAMHRLLEPLRLRAIDPEGASVDDIDDERDTQRWGARMPFTHLGSAGQARMVDVTAKPPTPRAATARGFVRCPAGVVAALRDGEVPKGDVLAVARIAGIAAAKRTCELLPLAHVIGIHGAEVDLEVTDEGVAVTATVRAVDRTGVEMEALTSVSVAALAVVDMVKGLDRRVSIEAIRLVAKQGGRSGTWTADDSGPV